MVPAATSKATSVRDAPVMLKRRRGSVCRTRPPNVTTKDGTTVAPATCAVPEVIFVCTHGLKLYMLEAKRSLGCCQNP